MANEIDISVAQIDAKVIVISDFKIQSETINVSPSFADPLSQTIVLDDLVVNSETVNVLAMPEVPFEPINVNVSLNIPTRNLGGSVGTVLIENLPAPDLLDESSSVFFFFGYDLEDGWLIERQTRATSISQRAARVNNPDFETLNEAWPERVSLNYA